MASDNTPTFRHFLYDLGNKSGAQAAARQAAWKLLERYDGSAILAQYAEESWSRSPGKSVLDAMRVFGAAIEAEAKLQRMRASEETGQMFGMLDYRAYRLRRLLYWPIRVLLRLCGWAITFMSVLIVQQSSLAATLEPYGPLAKFGAAYVMCELAGLVLIGVAYALTFVGDSVLFHIIDVVPCRGIDADEALMVAKMGPGVWLNRMLESDVAHWTSAHTREMVESLSWRARLLFPVKERMNGLVDYLKRLQTQGKWDTLSFEEKKDVIKSRITITRFERLVGNHYLFNGMVTVALILVSFSILH
jgi:hypothetical protein